jgi:hypothetical protein
MRPPLANSISGGRAGMQGEMNKCFLKWGGFAESRLIRVCGVGAGGVTDVSPKVLKEAEEASLAMMAQ